MQQELHSLSPFLREIKGMSAWHFAVQSGWGGLRECGECCAETELIQLHAHTHTCTQTQTSSDLRLWLRVQAAQIFVDMPQKHIAMNCFCEETTGGDSLHRNRHKGLKFQVFSYRSIYTRVKGM